MKMKELAGAADRAAILLRAVAHPARLRMICSLLEGELSAGMLARDTRLTAPALSQQATILESKGIISRRKQARSVFYRLAAPEARALARCLYGLYCHPIRRRARPG